MNNHDKYKEIKDNWHKAYDKQLVLVDEVITTSMWKAPGLYNIAQIYIKF